MAAWAGDLEQVGERPLEAAEVDSLRRRIRARKRWLAVYRGAGWTALVGTAAFVVGFVVLAPGHGMSLLVRALGATTVGLLPALVPGARTIHVFRSSRQPAVEVLPRSGLGWSEDGRPSAWRRLPR